MLDFVIYCGTTVDIRYRNRTWFFFNHHPSPGQIPFAVYAPYVASETGAGEGEAEEVLSKLDEAFEVCL